ncbi:MAG TPA: carboxypeptidase-like regulatory domain-containing protein [Terriglobales bacterium]|nr:carboxypeptidase-like regulatory domain-containing protein [Terriglobales bacterium]
MYRWCFVLMLLCSAFVISQAQDSHGIIRGTVLDEAGSPVQNAYVAADMMADGKIAQELKTYTDSTGQFVLEGLPLGEYQVSAQKEEDGYLSTRPNVFQHNKPVEVRLTPDNDSDSVTIHFSPKGAFVTGTVRDSKTGARVAAEITLKPENGDGLLGTGTNGKENFRLAVPANAGFTILISAPGYQNWVYRDEANPEQPGVLRLDSGSEKKLDVRLVPQR